MGKKLPKFYVADAFDSNNFQIFSREFDFLGESGIWDAG